MEKKKKTKRMRELVELLNKARRAYEQENTEIMSNFEYDRLYDELLSLEKELETTLASSPTVLCMEYYNGPKLSRPIKRSTQLNF